MQTKKGTPSRPVKRAPRRSVLSDEIYEMIKAMIFDHEIAPGSRVNIDALAVQLDVSQTPVREALARLESDGLIAKEPLKGYKATDLLSIKEFNDLFQFRLLIEPWAAEQAAKLIDNTGKTALKAEMQSAKTALKISGDDQIQALAEHDSRFHALIANISGNQTVAESYERIHCHLHLFRLFMANKLHRVEGERSAKYIQDLFEDYYESGSGQLALKEHDVIAKAIIEQNSKAARTAMHAHIESSLKRFSPAAQAINKK
ncbi:MAG: GntR family transcriptional regulator [Candidatus Nanopelagicaceae bacterium]